MTGDQLPGDLVDIVAQCYRLARGQLARADLTERDGDRYLDAVEVLEVILVAEGLDPDLVAHPSAVTTSPT